MAASQTKRVTIEVILAIVIVGLAYWLYETITTPAEELAQRERQTEMTRERLDIIRQAMIGYEQERDRYPGTLDSLVMFIEQDSMLRARLQREYGGDLMLDSLPFSPRTGKRFDLTTIDTLDIPVYKVTDPDQPMDFIGTLNPDPTEANRASWE